MSGETKISEEVSKIILAYRELHRSSSEYQQKIVYRIECNCCHTVLSDRGMRAVLLSDRSSDLFSTDLVPDTTLSNNTKSVGFVNGDYTAFYCYCRLRDIACLVCGNPLGYQINLPCKLCLSQENNGHYWMFRRGAVREQVIFVEMSETIAFPLYWAFVSATDDNGGDYFSGDSSTAAKVSCQLAVPFSSKIPIFVRKPRHLYIDVETCDRKRYNGLRINCLR
ncbi:unnamed protein product [Rhizopus stolonifer]